MNLLDGNVALVTGAVRGIGRAIAEKLAENGASIAFSGRSSMSAIHEFENYLMDNYSVRAKGFLSDASSFSQSSEFVQNVLTEFGKIDVLVNNAGITSDGLLLRMTEQQWDDVIDVNLKSVFNMTKSVIYPMLKAKKGTIINISSVVGINGNAGQSNYAAAKAGIIGVTKSMAKEFGSRGIRVNAVAPGFIATDMTSSIPETIREQMINNIPLKREGNPEDVANVVLFLASSLSSYITGQVIQVSGGMTF